MKKLFHFMMLAFFALSAQAGTINAARFGAKGDGITLDTAAIQRAIDSAAKHADTVTFNPGTYLTGSIFLKQGVTLNVPRGVIIMGSQRLEDYPVMPTRVAGIEMSWPAALINVYEQKNAAITGEGTIDGNGKVFWDHYWARRKEYEPRGLRWAADYDDQRPRLIQIYKSSGVKLGALNLRRSGFWTVHICYSDNVTVDGVVIRNNEGARGPSTDGIDIDSSRQVLIQHVDIENNDDALCLKSGRDADGLRVNRVTEDVVIRDSVIRVGAAGVTFGSETSGGFRNIEVYNLRVLAGAPSGILFKSAHTRGGFAENINIHDINMEGTPVPIRFTMNWNPSYSYAKIPDGLKDVPPYYAVLATPVPESKGIAHFHDIHIWNIKATGAKAAFDVNGNPAVPLDHIKIDHINIEAQTAGHITGAKDWTFSDVTLRIADGSVVDLKGASDIKGLPLTDPASHQAIEETHP